MNSCSICETMVSQRMKPPGPDLSPVCAVCEETAKAWLLKTITNADEHSIALVDAYYEITLKASNVDSVTVDQYFESLPQAPLDLFSIARIVCSGWRTVD